MKWSALAVFGLTLLIVDLKDMDRIFDFRVLNDYFRRPQKDEYDFYQHKIEIDNFETRYSNVVFSMFDDTSLLVLYLLLLGNNQEPFHLYGQGSKSLCRIMFLSTSISSFRYFKMGLIEHWVSFS